MQILIINYRFHFSGGPERYMFNVIEELEKRGHKIITFSVKNNKNIHSDYESHFPRNINNSNEFLFEKYKKGGLFYYDFLTREFYSFYIKNQLENLLKVEKIDVCYLLPHKGSLSPSIIDSLKKYNIPIVHRISDYNIICPQGGLYRNRHFCDQCKTSAFNVVKNKCIRDSYLYSALRYLSSKLHKKLKLYDKINYYITTNNFAKEQFIQFGFNPNKFITIETFANTIHRKKQIKSKYPIKFLFVGNIDDSKGIYDLIHAVKDLQNTYNETHLIINIYGGLRDYERQKVQTMITENNLNKVIFLNPVLSPEMILKVYKDSDITIIPTRWVENLPNVLIESISNGIPVIVPNFGSFSSVLNDSVAYFFTPYDVISLRDSIKSVIENPDIIATKSGNCFALANEVFNKEKHMETLLNIFKRYENN